MRKKNSVDEKVKNSGGGYPFLMYFQERKLQV